QPHILAYGDRETNAYLAVRFVPTFGVLANLFTELRTRLPQFEPRTMLDFGTGPGTAFWAAHHAWGASPASASQSKPSTSKGVQEGLGIDISESMLQAAEGIYADHSNPESEMAHEASPIPRLEFQRYLTYGEQGRTYDMVVSAFTLSELPSDVIRQNTLETLWAKTNDILVLVDRGTTAGFKMMHEAREHFIKLAQKEAGSSVAGCHIVAPCPHERACPLIGTTSWCHFSQQIQRPRFMMNVKKGKDNTEDVQYTYLILRRGPRPSATPSSPSSTASTSTVPQRLTLPDTEFESSAYEWSRMVFPPLKRGGHIITDSCTEQGQIIRRTFTKNDGRGDVWKDVRKIMWGDLLPY
ncbi:mitochondrial small ribosomal subunit Rsm22-domain-containing protein, partial [Dimargaris cristalligena]